MLDKLSKEKDFLADIPERLYSLTTGLAKELTLEKIQKLLDDTKEIPSRIIEISNLDIEYFKDLDPQEAKSIKEVFGLNTITELANLSYRQLLENSALMEEKGISQGKLELLITAAKYIRNAARYKIPEGQKIVVIGLDNAGKTALLNAINKEMVDFSKLKPTQGMQRQTIFLKEQKIYIFELGGQDIFRKQYLENPERYILGTDIMVFLIDMQDEKRYNVAFEYLTQILNIVKYLNENPEFIILLHKSDPNILKLQPLFHEKIDYVTGKVTKIFKQYSFKHSIQLSSIYNVIGLTQSFQYLLKKLFAGDLEREQELSAISELITRVLKMVLNIESDLTQEISDLSENLYKIKEELAFFKKSIISGEGGLGKETISTTTDTTKQLVGSRDPFIEELKQFLLNKDELEKIE